MENKKTDSDNTGKVPSYGGAQYRWNYDDYQREQSAKKNKTDNSRNIIGVAIIAVFLLAFVSVMAVFITDAILRSKGTSLTSLFGNDIMTSEEVADIGIESTVTVYCKNDSGKTQVSGTVIRSDGYILTAANTTENADSVSVTVNGESYAAEIIGINNRHNIAILKINATNLKTLTSGEAEDVKAGSPAVITGLTTGLSSCGLGAILCSISNPSVYAFADIADIYQETVTVKSNTIKLMQISDNISAETIGSPLLDMKGEIIGIIIARTSYGIGYAIPTDETFANIVNEIIDVRKLDNLSMTARTIPEENVGKYKISAGCLACCVEKGGTADSAGIKENDIIISVNGQDVFNAYDLEKLTSAEGELTLWIYRSSEYIEIVINQQ